MKQHQYAKAAAEYRVAINRHDRLAVAYAGLGNAQFQLKKYPQAYLSYKQALKLAPKNLGVLYYTAYTALYANDYAGSKKYISQYIKVRRRDAAAYHIRFLAEGRLLDKTGQEQDASIVVQLQPHNADAFDDLGIALSNNNKYQQAKSAFTTAIKLKPGRWNFYKNRAIVENRLKQKSAFLADLKMAYRLAPPGVEKHNLKIVIEKIQGTKHP